MVDAYDCLAAEGVITACRGSGFYVADSPLPFAITDIGPRVDRAIDSFWVLRQPLDANVDTLKPSCGWFVVR